MSHAQHAYHSACFLTQLTLSAEEIESGAITRKTVEATRPYLQLEHFNRETIEKKSKAAAGLCDWAINIVKYFDVVVEVAPKKAELAAANEKLAAADETLKVSSCWVSSACGVAHASCVAGMLVLWNVRLQERAVDCFGTKLVLTWHVSMQPSHQSPLAHRQPNKACPLLQVVMAKVAELNAMVADLEAQFDAANKDKNDAIAEQQRCDRKLSLANRLISALASEGERWAATVEQLQLDFEVLTGDMLLAAAFVSYAGPFTASFRADLIKQFLDFMKAKGTPMTPGLSDPLKILVDEAVVAGWVKEGLPSDPTSVQNGTILNNSERWPLIMDPQLQGIVWIKEREARNDLKVVRMEDDKKVCANVSFLL